MPILMTIEPHRSVSSRRSEGPGSREPIRFVLLTRALQVDVKIQRAFGIVCHSVAITDRKRCELLLPTAARQRLHPAPDGRNDRSDRRRRWICDSLSELSRLFCDR
jgi:hypothetical protein